MVAPVSPAVKSPPPTMSTPIPPAMPIAGTDETDSEAPAALPAVSKPFAPQTHAQGMGFRAGWTPPRGALARLPIWGIAAGAAAVVILICLLIVMIKGGKGAPQNAAASGNDGVKQGVPPNPGREGAGNGQSLIPQHIPDAPNNRGPAPGKTTPPPVPENAGPARAFEPRQIARSPDLYYVLIAQTPEREIAERNAKFIAQNGVDVSIEILRGKIYALISVQGSRTLEEGEALRAKIVQIGHLLPEYKKTRRAWDDATLQRFRKPADPPAAAG